MALLETGRTREAIDKLEDALEKQPDNPDLLYYLSQAHARLTMIIAQLHSYTSISFASSSVKRPCRRVSGMVMAATSAMPHMIVTYQKKIDS